MTLQAHDSFGGTACRKHRRLLTLAAALLLGAGGIMNSLPAFADPGEGGAGGENSAGEGNYDHSGIYTTLFQASRGDFANSSASFTSTKKGYYYLQGHGWVPLNLSSKR
jgi:hypothetical protein